MKKLFLLPLFLLALSATIFAQQDSNDGQTAQASIVGKWAGEFPGPDGKPIVFTMTITQDTYTFDYGSDGAIDSNGAYTAYGDQVTVWDIAGKDICPSDQKGIYKFTIDGDTATFTKVKDDCPGRGDAPLVVKRL